MIEAVIVLAWLLVCAAGFGLITHRARRGLEKEVSLVRGLLAAHIDENDRLRQDLGYALSELQRAYRDEYASFEELLGRLPKDICGPSEYTVYEQRWDSLAHQISNDPASIDTNCTKLVFRAEEFGLNHRRMRGWRTAGWVFMPEEMLERRRELHG